MESLWNWQVINTAAKSVLGILAFMCLILLGIALVFFKSEHVLTKIFVFILFLLLVAGFTYSITKVKPEPADLRGPSIRPWRCTGSRRNLQPEHPPVEVHRKPPEEVEVGVSRDFMVGPWVNERKDVAYGPGGYLLQRNTSDFMADGTWSGRGVVPPW